MTERTPSPTLFSPLKVGGRTLRNRLCLSATVTNYAAGNRITERWKDFLIERARGGTAMLVTEVIAVDEEALAQGSTVTGFDDTNNDDFKDTAERVHIEGGQLVGQLWHPGRQQLWHPTKSPMGVSDQPDAYSWTVPHVMSDGEVQRVVEAYVATAERLWRCGFAGVELHGAHGYLITQFLSPWSNTRTDQWGGDLEGRTRFAREIAQGIRQRCASDFVIGIKIPGLEGVDGGIDLPESTRIAARLAGTGDIDYIACGQGNFSLSLETHVPDIHFKPGHFIDVHKALKAAAGQVPVMALGRIGRPELAETVVADGYADLVGMSRALIADAAFGKKAASGRAREIRPSVFDNFAWGEIHVGKPLAEFHNPRLGSAGEADWSPVTTGEPKRVAVIGAGPGGLEAAWTAAAAGHTVILFGRSPDPGGAYRLETLLPGRAEIADVINHQIHLCRLHGVEMRFGGEADVAAIRAVWPDVVVLATGGDERAAEEWMTIEPDMSGITRGARSWLRGHGPQEGRSAVLFDQDHGPTVYAVADLLAERFERVTLVTPRPQIAQAVNYCSAIGVHKRLHQAGVDIVTAARPVDFSAGTLVLENVYGGPERALSAVDLLVHAVPRRANDRLETALREACPDLPLHLVGDCRSPRNLMAAIHGGHAVACGL